MKFDVYYTEGTTSVKSYESSKKIELTTPFVLENKMGNNLDVQNAVCVANLDTKYSNKTLIFNGCAYIAKIYLDGELVKENEGVWNKFSVNLPEITDSVELIIELIRVNFEKDSDLFFRKTLYGFVPDICMPFSGIWKQIDVVDNEDLEMLDYIINDCSIKFTKKLDSIKIYDNDKLIEEFTNADNVEVSSDLIIYWTPKKPKVYDLHLELNGETKKVPVTFTNFNIIENRMYFSEEAYYMKGILHWGYYPDAISPSLPYEEAEKEILKIKKMGFNTIKMCLFFHEEHYYELCEKHGMVVWQEFPLWLPTSDKIVETRFQNELSTYILNVGKYSNVPIITIGCELNGTMDERFVEKMYLQTKEVFTNRIICDNSGSNECFAASDVKIETDFYDYHFYGEVDDFSELVTEFTRDYRKSKPWLFGEFNDSDTWREIKVDDTEWWKSTDEKVNLLMKVHEGFDSIMKLDQQASKLGSRQIDHERLTVDSYIKSLQFRKNIFEIIRQNNQICGFNITAIRDTTCTSGIFDDEMEPKFDEKDFNNIIGDFQLLLAPPTRRKWINGGDIYFKDDIFNAQVGNPKSYQVLLSNINSEKVDIKIEIYLNDKLIYSNKTFADKHISKIDDIEVLFEQLGSNVITLNCEVGNEIYENRYPIEVSEPINSELVLQKYELKNKLSIEIPLIKSWSEISGDAIITNYLTPEMEQAVDKDTIIIYFIEGNEYFELNKCAFWREGILYEAEGQDTSVNVQNPQHLSSMAPKHAILETEITEKIGEYTPIISRIDGRKFYLSEYIFKKGNTWFITLDAANTEKSYCLKKSNEVAVNALVASIMENK